MKKSRLHLTLITLRPDGRNRTWALTRRKFLWLSAGAVVLVILVAVLLYAVVLQRIEYRQLWDKYQLMAGREIVAVSPQPAPADRVPGAAELPAAAMQTSQQPLQPGVETVPSERRAALDEVRQAVGAVVRLEDFRLRPLDGGDGWELNVQLTKTEWTSEVQRGFVAILIEDVERPGRFLTLPPMTIVNGRPLSAQAGESFAIRRLKPIRYEFSLPEGFRMREVQMLVYDREGRLLLERVFPVEGGS
jgi:hypothetical protein